jgi:hypothetical protein
MVDFFYMLDCIFEYDKQGKGNVDLLGKPFVAYRLPLMILRAFDKEFAYLWICIPVEKVFMV